MIEAIRFATRSSYSEGDRETLTRLALVSRAGRTPEHARQDEFKLRQIAERIFEERDHMFLA